MKKLFILFLIVFGALSAAAQAERYARPFDEAKRDASFLAFRTKLVEAVARRDARHVLSILDQNILNSYGGRGGVEEFKRMWKIDSPQSAFWAEFAAAVNNGGKFMDEGAPADKTFWAPYLFSSFGEDLDAFEHQAIFGRDVRLRARPSLDAPVVAGLSYNVVKTDFENSVKDPSREGEYLWYKIETLGGVKGFVKAEYVRSPIDYRAGFQKKNGGWKLTAFIAGD